MLEKNLGYAQMANSTTHSRILKAKSRMPMMMKSPKELRK